MDESTKEQLIVQFRHYLDNEITLSPEKIKPVTDLFSLFTELEGLRNEIKLESRQVKNALEQFRAVFELLQTSHTNWVQETAQNQANQDRLHREEIRRLLLELIDLHDRLEVGSKASLYPQFMSWFRFCQCHSQTNFIHSIHEGQAITLRRLTETLTRYQVQPLTVVGRVFDPYCMRAAAIDTLPNVENGVVIEELRKGFVWGEEVLRLAEVKVNKKIDGKSIN